ncbi:MAG: glycosyltransferase family 2 protein [Thermoprotei archaeon]|nr:glycosyltransferase family 2 protein [Thermoprotei archaeon]
MRVDAVLLTKDCISQKQRRLVFYNCLLSLANNVPVRKLIVVDGGSKDGTLQFIIRLNKRFSLFPHIQFIDDAGGTRATARMKGIRAVRTEWFVFIDSDCILCSNWFENALKHVNENVGAVEGDHKQILNAKDTRFLQAREILTRKFSRLAKGRIADVWFKKGSRGFTGNTLIRSDLVKDIKIPPYYHVLEDYYIKCWIERKGFKWIKVADAYCYHYTQYHRPRDAYYSSYILAKEGKLTLKRALISTLTALPKYMLIGYPDCGLREFRLSLYRLSGVCRGVIT